MDPGSQQLLRIPDFQYIPSRYLCLNLLLVFKQSALQVRSSPDQACTELFIRVYNLMNHMNHLDIFSYLRGTLVLKTDHSKGISLGQSRMSFQPV